jgi:error-prone DNA polymerase
VVFVTLEDEHGFVNLVLFAKTFERLRRVATTSSMLYVEGKVERQAESSEAPVVYIVVEKLERMSLRGKSIPAMSRDFR